MIHLLQASQEELCACFRMEDSCYICSCCGRRWNEQEVFPIDGRYLTARAAIQSHIAKEHRGALEVLLAQEKRYTGLTDHQKELLRMFAAGLPDAEIAKRTATAVSTVRHQRFLFREKAKQAKLYLAIYSLSCEQENHRDSDKLIDVPESASILDQRFEITQAEEEKILNTCFSSLSPLKLKLFPVKDKKKVVILKKILAQFEENKRYTEKEVNAILGDIYEDFVTLRRYLIEYGFLDRTRDCREYWRK